MTPERIKGLRESLGWSQSALADLTDCHFITVSKWENRRAEPGAWQVAFMEVYESLGQRSDAVEVGKALRDTYQSSGVVEALWMALKLYYNR